MTEAQPQPLQSSVSHSKVLSSHHRRHQSLSKRSKKCERSIENSENNYQRFKELLYPQPIAPLRRPNYLHAEDIPGAKPKLPTPLQGRDYLNITDIDGSRPKRPPLYYQGKNLMLDVRDINGKVKERVGSKSAMRSQDYYINFSNPHLGKPSWCYNMRSKLNVRNYRWGEAPINELLFPDKVGEEQIKSKRTEYRLPELISKAAQTESRPNSIRRMVIQSNRSSSKRSIETQERANSSMEVGSRRAVSDHFTCENPVVYSKHSRRSANKSVDISNIMENERKIPSTRRMLVSPLESLKPPRPVYCKMNIDKMLMYGDSGKKITPTFFSQVPIGAGNLSTKDINL